MKLQKVFKVPYVLLFIPVIFFVFFVTGPAMAVEELTPKGVMAEELPPGEELPAGEGFWDRWMFIADFSAFYTSTDVSGSSTTDGANVNGLFAPVYQINDRTFGILMLDGQYYEKREYYSDEQGGRERVEYRAHSITPMVRFDFGERLQYSLTPSLFWTWTYNKDNTDTSWRDGLYNYRDFGGGLDFDMRGVYGDQGTLALGVQYYAREYPNYASLLSLTGLDLINNIDAERAEKDYDGIVGKVGYSWVNPLGFSWDMEYSWLNKKLDVKKVVSSQGTLTGEEVEEDLHSLDVNFQYIFDIDGGLKLGLDLNGTTNDSNQNYWDELRPGVNPGVDPNKYTSNYYDYDSYRIRPNVSYTFALFPLTPSLSYSYTKTEYDNRKAEYNDGDYKGENQEDIREEIGFGLEYELTANWALLGQYEYLNVSSNSEDERVYKYSYTANIFSVGVSFKY